MDVADGEHMGSFYLQEVESAISVDPPNLPHLLPAKYVAFIVFERHRCRLTLHSLCQCRIVAGGCNKLLKLNRPHRLEIAQV